MMIQTIMQQKGMSQYRLSKTSGIPYTTVHDICSGRAQLEKCSAETVYKLAQALESLQTHLNKLINSISYNAETLAASSQPLPSVKRTTKG